MKPKNNNVMKSFIEYGFSNARQRPASSRSAGFSSFLSDFYSHVH